MGEALALSRHLQSLGTCIMNYECIVRLNFSVKTYVV